MNYAEISKETISLLIKSYESLKNSPLNSTIRVLVELRTSQMNGCEYCIRLHTKEAMQIHVPEEKIKELSSWKKSAHFSEKEKAALSWCESVTQLDKHLEEKRKALSPYFSERKLWISLLQFLS